MRFLRSPGVIISIVAAALMAGLLIYGQASTKQDRPFEEILPEGERKAAPNEPLKRFTGKGTGRLSDYRGKVVVVNFWASWCAPCRKEAPVLENFWKRYRDRDLILLGINSLDVESDARRFVKRFRLTYPMLRDTKGEARRSWKLTGFPETYVVDRKGRIASVRRGEVNRETLERLVLPVLTEKS